MSLTKTQGWTDLANEIAGSYEVDPIAVLAIIAQESGGDPNAVNNSGGDAKRGGSYGLMQMSLRTAQGYGYTGDGPGLLDPRTNVDLGVRYLRDCFAQSGGDLNGAAQAYNSGRTTGSPSYGSQVVSFYNKLGGQYGSPESGQADGSPLAPDSSESGGATVAILILAVVLIAGLAAVVGGIQ